MNPPSVPLRAVLVGLALLTVAATAERVVGLSSPMPTREAPHSLSLNGFSVSPLGGTPPRQGRELSQGTLRRFRLQPLTGGEPLTVLLLPVRSRTGSELTQDSKERKGLNMVAVAEEVPLFALKERRILTLAGSKPDHVALGRGPTDSAGSVTRLQTCLVPSGHAGVSAYTLVGESQEKGESASGSALERRGKRLAGLSQAHYECLAVQVESTNPHRSTLVETWKGVKRALLAS